MWGNEFAALRVYVVVLLDAPDAEALQIVTHTIHKGQEFDMSRLTNGTVAAWKVVAHTKQEALAKVVASAIGQGGAERIR